MVAEKGRARLSCLNELPGVTWRGQGEGLFRKNQDKGQLRHQISPLPRTPTLISHLKDDLLEAGFCSFAARRRVRTPPVHCGLSKGSALVGAALGCR